MTDSKRGAWSDSENYALLFGIVQQLVGDGKMAIKFDKITLPGRTTRALQERWGKIKNDVNAAGLANSGPAGVSAARTPRGTSKKAKATNGAVKSNTPSKRKTKTEGDDEDEMIGAIPTPKRRRSPVKKEAVKNEQELEEEEGDDEPVQQYNSGYVDLPASPKSYHSVDYYE